MDLIERTQAALEGVTDGPWEYTGGIVWHTEVIAVPDPSDPTGQTPMPEPIQESVPTSAIDAEFIAAARTLVPELLAALIEARREVNDLSGVQADADELFQKVQQLEAKVRRLEGDS